MRRLTILLTDTPTNRAAAEVFAPTGRQAPSGPEAVERLFFGHTGLVDVHAAAAGEFAAPRLGEGGIFTLALTGELAKQTAGGKTWAALSMT